jgi:CRP-like cAMP-binding protein
MKRREQHPLTYALSKNLLFEDIGLKDLSQIAEVLFQRTFERGECIFKQHDRGFGLYLVERGSVRILREQEGESVTLATLGPSTFFGEMALIEKHNLRTATALALEESHVLGLFKPDLDHLLLTKPRIGVQILLRISWVLSRRLTETNATLSLLQDRLEAGEATKTTSSPNKS